MDLPDILNDQNVKPAAKLLHRYYLEHDKKGLLSTGSYFDEWAGRGDTANRDPCCVRWRSLTPLHQRCASLGCPWSGRGPDQDRKAVNHSQELHALLGGHQGPHRPPIRLSEEDLHAG